jgi:sugar/nucleoside kinase (ribokinase family)
VASKVNFPNVFDVCAIGHITKDTLRIKNSETEQPGGAAYYFSMALKNLGSNIALVTKATETDKEFLLKELIVDNTSIFYRNSPETTAFENIYPYPENLDVRIQNVTSVAEPFNIQDIPDIHSRIYHLGPLTKGDIPVEILEYLSKKGKISLDVQGFLRKIETGRVQSTNWEDKEEGLTYVSILKADEDEAKILSGCDNRKEAAIKLSAYGIDEVIITLGSNGSLIWSKEGFYSIPSFPPRTKEPDPTGCGDTYMAGYIYKRLRAFSVEESGRFAAALSSLKLERPGVFRGCEEDVRNFLESQSIKESST